MKLIKTSKDIQGEIDRYNPYQKKLESMNERRKVIYRLEQMQLKDKIEHLKEKLK